jgi:hypothetical protein
MVKITNVKFGEIEIDGKTYFSDMIVWWDGKIEYIPKTHEFEANEFLKIIKRKPEIIVIGRGMEGFYKIAEEVKQLTEDKGIEIFSEVSPKAAEMFNAFVAEKRKVVAVIHTTS